jgi:hypothetical protein
MRALTLIAILCLGLWAPSAKDGHKGRSVRDHTDYQVLARKIQNGPDESRYCYEYIRVKEAPAWTAEQYRTFDQNDPDVQQLIACWKRTNESAGCLFSSIEPICPESYVDPSRVELNSRDFLICYERPMSRFNPLADDIVNPPGE